MAQAKIQIKFGETDIVDLLIDNIDTSTDQGTLSYRVVSPSVEGLADLWTQHFLGSRGLYGFSPTSGYISYDEVVYVLDQLRPIWDYVSESPPPQGKPFVHPPFVIH